SCRRLPRTGRGRGHPFSHAACFASSTPPAAPPNLKHLRSQGNNPHEILLPQLAGDRSKDAGPPRVLLLVDDDRGVFVEADVRAVRALHRTLGPDHHRLDHVALLDDPAGGRLLHGSYDNITNPGVAPLGAAQHPDAQQALRPGVIGNVQDALLLDHRPSALLPAARLAARASQRILLHGKRSASPFQDFHDPPALLPGQRPGLHHPHAVAHAALVVLIMRLQANRPTYAPCVERMPPMTLVSNESRIVKLLNEHHAGLGVELTPLSDEDIRAYFLWRKLKFSHILDEQEWSVMREAIF